MVLSRGYEEHFERCCWSHRLCSYKRALFLQRDFLFQVLPRSPAQISAQSYQVNGHNLTSCKRRLSGLGTTGQGLSTRSTNSPRLRARVKKFENKTWLAACMPCATRCDFAVSTTEYVVVQLYYYSPVSSSVIKPLVRAKATQ